MCEVSLVCERENLGILQLVQKSALRDKEALVLAWETKSKGNTNKHKDKEEFKEIHYCYLMWGLWILSHALGSLDNLITRNYLA